MKSRELVKSIRSRLHQIGGAYLPVNLNPDSFSSELTALPHNINSPEIQAFCHKQMEQHASTKERLPLLDHFFKDILGDLPTIRSVLDLACGLTPLSLPWIPLHPEATYTAVDMYQRLAESLQIFFDHSAFHGQAVAADIITYPLDQPRDVVFLLKTLPCLEQQGKGFAGELLNRVQAKTIVISYPLRTLGGSAREGRHYEQIQPAG